MKIFKIVIVLSVFTVFSASSYAGELTAMDYIEIEQLYVKYNFAIDSGDAEGYAATFTPDGVFNTFEGHDALVGFIKRYVETMNGSQRRHWNTNLRITGDDKKVNGSVYLMMLDLTKPETTISTSAVYIDTLIKTADGWRFTKRTTTSDRPPATK